MSATILHDAHTWQARLALAFEKRDVATVLANRSHFGPLRIQKSLYPEGREVCHAVVLHPPSGIAGGDKLEISLDVRPGAHALVTTPGAGKWYRSVGPDAHQLQQLHVDAGGVLEWLPQETIIFNGARAVMRNEIELDEQARFIGQEILCFGRRASGEAFEAGGLNLHTRIRRGGRLVWLERGFVAGGGTLLHSPVGLGGFSVAGTLIVSAPQLESGLLAACREIKPVEASAKCGITPLPDLWIARYLGHRAESARQWCAGLWDILRPALIGKKAVQPRIWHT